MSTLLGARRLVARTRERHAHTKHDGPRDQEDPRPRAEEATDDRSA